MIGILFQVVAPVRETCAQVLGVVVNHMAVERVHGCVHILLKLLTQTQWEVRHGGLLGLKYLLSVRQVVFSFRIVFVRIAVF